MIRPCRRHRHRSVRSRAFSLQRRMIGIWYVAPTEHPLALDQTNFARSLYKYSNAQTWYVFATRMQCAAKDCKELLNLRKDFETTQEENQFLNFELAAAKEQIETLEKTIFAVRI